jgi:hypothetical protein
MTKNIFNGDELTVVLPDVLGYLESRNDSWILLHESERSRGGTNEQAEGRTAAIGWASRLVMTTPKRLENIRCRVCDIVLELSTILLQIISNERGRILSERCDCSGT